MAIETKEITFEREIEYSLLDHGGYIKGNPRDYNREFAVDTKHSSASSRRVNLRNGPNYARSMAVTWKPAF